MVHVSQTTFRLNALRNEFPYLNGKAYFNYGGQGSMPRRSINALHEAHDRFQALGPFSSQANAWLIKESSLTRTAIADELGVGADSITLTEDVTVGCNIALWGIDWQAGDHILITDCEHQGIIAAVRELQRRFKLEVSICPVLNTLNAGDPVSIVRQCLRSNTRLVVLSHILWNTGQVLPLADIVSVCGSVPVLVDAAQSIGVLPLDLSEIGVDFYAFTGHKWWCGAAGVGGLYVRPDARERLSPTFIGWRSVIVDANGQPIDWQPDGRRYEIATSAVPLYGALREAIDVHNQFASAQERYCLILNRSAYLWRRLTQITEVHCLKNSPPEAGLVSFQIASGKHAQLVQFLEEKNFFLRVILNPNCVRACVHYFTTEREIDALIEAITEFLS